MGKLPSYEDLQNKIAYLEKELSSLKSNSNLNSFKNINLSLFYEICEYSKNAIALFETNNDGVSFNLKYFNKKAEEIEHVKRGDVVGKNIAISFPSVLESGFIEALRRVYQFNESEEFPSIVFSSGKIVEWKQNYIFKLSDSEVASIYIDETENKKKEFELHESREKLQIAMEAASYYSFEIDLTTIKITTHKELYSDLGYKHPEIDELMQKTGSLIQQEDFKRAHKIISKHTRNIKPSLNTEFRVKNKNGKWIWFKASGKVIDWDKNSKPLRFVGLLKNIQEEKELLIQLKESEENFRQLAENINDAFWLRSLENEVIYANPACYKIAGDNFNEIFTDFNAYKNWIHPDDRVQIVKQREKNLKNLDKIHFYEHRIIKPDGEIRWVWIRTFPVFNSLGKLYRRAGITSDITNQKKMLSDLLFAKEKAEIGDKLKSAFLANMSHEIRTPMNGILGFAELLKDRDLTEKEKSDYLKIINSNGKELLNLINDIIDVAKIEAGQLSINKSIAEINPLLEEMYQMFFEIQKRILKQDIKFTLKIPSNEKNLIFTDISRLKQILNNLLSNAFKFTSSGSVEFGYNIINSNGVEHYQFFVSDTGIGINKDMQEYIFKRFGQAQTKKYKNQQGTGLGLAISKGLIELLKGKIWLESSPETIANDSSNGSSFYFTIPIVSNMSFPEQVDLDLKPITEMKTLEKVTILIVEDNQDNLEFLSRLLTRYGAEIVIAKTGEEAINIVKSNDEIKIVLMDIRLPDINGFETTQEIKKINPKLPVIAQTAYAMYNDREMCLENGCDDYISKPLDKDVLFQKINHYIYN
ncbi:PAS domain-containing protein [Bacteroidota bacterium]